MVHGKHTKNNNYLKGNLHKQHDDNMPSASTAKTVETTAYNTVQANPFTQIHGHPTRKDYDTLKKEASDLASKVEDITYNWAQDTNTGDEYGLFTEIIGELEYTLLTGVQWVQEVELAKLIRQSHQPLQHTQESEWKRNGKKNAHHGISKKDSYAA